MVLPVAKLALMSVKIITKPIANGVKAQAKNHAAFRTACVAFGRAINRVTVSFNNRLLGRYIYSFWVFIIILLMLPQTASA